MTNKNNGSSKMDKGNRTVGNGNVTADKSKATADKSDATIDNSEVTAGISEVTVDKSRATADKGEATADKGFTKENKDYPLKEFYKKIYGRYDLVNRIFTFGQDSNWRKKAVEECLGNAPKQVLDICTGTGDLVLEMAQKADRTEDSAAAESADVAAQGKDLSDKGPLEKDAKGKGPIAEGPSEKDKRGKGAIAEGSSEIADHVKGPAGVNLSENAIRAKVTAAAAVSTPIHLTGYDFSPEMLDEARKKAADAGRKIEFIEGNVAEMPFADNRFDTAGITFGIRNLIYENSNSDRHMAEIHRVLRMNGRLVVLESSKPDSRVWRFFNGIYLQFILPWLGGLISGNLKAYRYLAKSSKNYYSRREMARILEQAGFRVIRSRPLFLGSVMLLVAEKQAKAE